MGELLTLFLSTVLINNIILSQFLGMCPFMGVSKNRSSALGMGFAVLFVIVGSSLITYFLYHGVLVTFGLEYLQLITFILVIACFVQFTELFLKKFSPALYKPPLFLRRMRFFSRPVLHMDPLLFLLFFCNLFCFFQ